MMLSFSIAIEVEDCKEMFAADSTAKRPDAVGELAVECIQKLIEANDFTAANIALDILPTDQTQSAMTATREAS